MKNRQTSEPSTCERFHAESIYARF
jgi:hypothetical protein